MREGDYEMYQKSCLILKDMGIVSDKEIYKNTDIDESSFG